jgi:hypothetical protein
MSAMRTGAVIARRLPIALVLVAAAAGVLAASSAALAHPVRPVERASPEIPQARAAVAPGAATPLAAAATADGPRAYRQAPPDAAVPGSPEPATVAIALLGAAVALGIAARHRRALALALILIGGLLAFEGGVHSVHHLDSPRDMSRCAVAAAAVHVPGAIDAPPAPPDGPDRVSEALPSLGPQRPGTRAWRAGRGRAPPLFVPA